MAALGACREFISHSLEYMYLIKASDMLSCPVNMMPLMDVMDQCDVLWAV